VNAEFGYVLALVTGVLGAFHCLSMCSGINGGFFLHRGRFPALPAVLLFHAARIGVYGLFGVSGALLGRVLTQTGLFGKGQGILLILAGLLVVLLGLRHLSRGGAVEQAGSLRVAAPSPTQARLAPLAAGLLNGLVPCGLVFAVAIKAAATQDALQAVLLMLAFGIGTLPVMGAVSLLGATIGARLRGHLARIAGLTVVLLGLWTLYQGVVFYDIMQGLANG
jgi:uncharacterized protein